MISIFRDEGSFSKKEAMVKLCKSIKLDLNSTNNKKRRSNRTVSCMSKIDEDSFEDLIARFEVDNWFTFEPKDAPGCTLSWGCRTGDQGRDLVIRCSGAMTLKDVAEVHPELPK
jgi:hypothetical protein